MRFGDKDYKKELSLARCPPKHRYDEALLAAHKRVLTLEAEIKVLCDGAGKDGAEIERLREEVFNVIRNVAVNAPIGASGTHYWFNAACVAIEKKLRATIGETKGGLK